MRSRVAICLILFITFPNPRCKGKELTLSPREYISWFNTPGNGCIEATKSHGLNFELQYRSPKFLAILAIEKEEISQIEYDSVKLRFEGLNWFVLKIASEVAGESPLGMIESSNDGSSIEILNYGIERFFSLRFGDEVRRCEIHHFENSFPITPFVTLVLGFEEKQIGEFELQKKDIEVTFLDPIFGCEKLEWSFPNDVFQNLPELLLKK